MNVQQVNEESWLSHEENGKHEQTKKVNVREEIDTSVKLYIDTSNINKKNILRFNNNHEVWHKCDKNYLPNLYFSFFFLIKHLTYEYCIH